MPRRCSQNNTALSDNPFAIQLPIELFGLLLCIG